MVWLDTLLLYERSANKGVPYSSEASWSVTQRWLEKRCRERIFGRVTKPVLKARSLLGAGFTLDIR
jgi:hypothetical protein